MPTVIRSEVYVNSVVFPVPYMLCNLTHAELADMEANGAYCDLSPERILPHLALDVLDQKLHQLQLDYHTLLDAKAAHLGVRVTALSLRIITQQLLRFSGVSWGGRATEMRWLPVLKKCDTKSKIDTRRIIAHGWQHAPTGCNKPVIQVKFGDGQTNHRDRDEKRDNPEIAKGVVVAVGNFHPMFHFMACCITGWWYCVVCCFVNHLGLEKVPATLTPTRTPGHPAPLPPQKTDAT